MSREDGLRRRLAAWLEQHGRSPRWLSVEAGVSENTVWRYLQGATRNLRPENWRRVAAVVGWDAATVLADAGYEAPSPPPVDPAGAIDRLLQQAGVPDSERQPIMHFVRGALERAAASRSAASG